MGTSIDDRTLDKVLALQLTVAWAGEGRCQPKRLGWWDTDVIDPDGGGDFFARLAPRTHRWAALEAALEAARRTDAEGRRKLGDADLLRTLFFLGFELDEQLADRRVALHREGTPPAVALSLPLELGSAWSLAALTRALELPEGQRPQFSVVPGGRELKGAVPAAPAEQVANLASALFPAPEQYPLPFYRVRR
ncbi:MAG: BREX-6 system BrxE protein [Deltaproteobacteria bacterium]|nr:BREX-6 system BrxE protein [Deltaproteobacteria bacterium]